MPCAAVPWGSAVWIRQYDLSTCPQGKWSLGKAVILNWNSNLLCFSGLIFCSFLLLYSQGSQDAERGLSSHDKYLGSVSETFSWMTVHCMSWITRLYEFYTAPVVKFWFHTVGGVNVVMLYININMWQICIFGKVFSFEWHMCNSLTGKCWVVET